MALVAVVVVEIGTMQVGVVVVMVVVVAVVAVVKDNCYYHFQMDLSYLLVFLACF